MSAHYYLTKVVKPITDITGLDKNEGSFRVNDKKEGVCPLFYVFNAIALKRLPLGTTCL